MKLFTNVLVTIAVMLGILALYQRFILPKYEKKIYVVDTSRLIVAEKKLLRLGLNQGNINADEVKKLDLRFKKIINYIAKRDNAIVLVKRALLSNNYDKDITNEVLMMGVSK